MTNQNVEGAILVLAQAGEIPIHKVRYIFNTAIDMAAIRCEREAEGMYRHGLQKMGQAAQSCASAVRRLRSEDLGAEVIPMKKPGETK
jgi:hypothetical protein